MNRKFDLITMNDLIEHLENPDEAIKKARLLLNEGGCIYISTPKGDSLVCKLTRGRWLHRKPREHLYVFTSDTMTEMLKNNGFKVLYFGTIGRIRSIDVIIRKIDSYSSFASAFLNIIVPKHIRKYSISFNPLY